jgi:hypothetical protein
VCGWVASDGRTEDGYGWCQIVGRRMGMGGVKWWDGGWVWVVSNGGTEDGDGEGNCHGLIKILFRHLPRRSLENNKNVGHIFPLPLRSSNRPSSK